MKSEEGDDAYYHLFLAYLSFTSIALISLRSNLNVTMLFPTLLLASLVHALPKAEPAHYLEARQGSSGFTMLRFGCAQAVIDRIDPLVNPGQAPSPHMHQVVGGNAFNISMASTDVSKLASCTTCGYSEDVSRAWG
jgi:hypothetical protein